MSLATAATSNSGPFSSRGADSEVVYGELFDPIAELVAAGVTRDQASIAAALT